LVSRLWSRLEGRCKKSGVVGRSWLIPVIVWLETCRLHCLWLNVIAVSLLPPSVRFEGVLLHGNFRLVARYFLLNWLLVVSSNGSNLVVAQPFTKKGNCFLIDFRKNLKSNFELTLIS